MLNPRRRPAQREYERASKIEPNEQRVYQDVFVDDHLPYAASQAWAATTSVSTPVAKVGWITGAKRGL